MSAHGQKVDADGRRPVELHNAPVVALEAAQLWLDDLFHELQVLAVGEEQGRELPPELARLGEELRGLIERPRFVLFEQLAAASAAGHAHADLVVELRPTAVAPLARTMLLLDELDEHCRAGVLLTPPRTSEVYGALRWLAREIVGQLEVGRAPRPFRPPDR